MKNIALAFSGGGFRAAAFSLGTLSYLNAVKDEDISLLKHVKFIGSTSGGSITNLMYAAGTCEGKSFEEIYSQLFDALKGDNLMARVFDILADDGIWDKRPKKSRNLINAFSIAYDEEGFLKGQTMGLFSEKISQSHLEEITVNATEFSNGISFRFQTQQKDSIFPRGRVGNNYIYFKRTNLAAADKLKLGDLLACSSCFPGGFEPFIFPDDFTHADLVIKELSAAVSFKNNPFSVQDKQNDILAEKDFEKLNNRFGLMDGGVADNQAIDSVLLANSRRIKAKLPGFDLIMATDVTSYFMDGYTLPLAPEHSGISLRLLKNLFLVTGLIFPLLVLAFFLPIWRSWMYLFVLLTFGAGFIWLWLNIVLSKAKKNADIKKSTWLIVVFKYGRYFTKLGINVLRHMIFSRLKSVLLLTEDIYLKQIRRHYYNMVYRDPLLSPIFISNAIYDLSRVKQKSAADPDMEKVIGFNSISDVEDVLLPPAKEKLIAVAERARLMPTTLWFDKYHEQDKMRETIIATGQFTACYNLLKYLTKLETAPASATEQSSAEKSSRDLLKASLLADWERFNNDPYFMVPPRR